MFDLHTIIKNNELAERDAKAKRIALIKSELAKLDNSAVREILSKLADKE